MSKCDFRRSIGILAVIAVLMSLAGCRKGEVELATVEGIVTLDGQPLPEAYVRFAPEFLGRSSGGTTDAEGHYTLAYTARDMGALVGPAVVSITTGDPERPKEKPERVPRMYNHETNLKVEVEPGSNTFNFDLKSQ